MSRMRRIILAGGSGYLGKILAGHFTKLGWEVVVLTRHTYGKTNVLFWDGATVGDWAAALEDSEAVVNLAGRTVNCRYTPKHQREIYDSRVVPTRTLGAAIGRCVRPPRVWVNLSSATIYRHALDRPMDEETGEVGSGFSVDVCEKWEQALAQSATPRTRKIALRTAIVLGPGEGGAFAALHRLVRLGLGGTLGSGKQFVSWVHALDFARVTEWVVEREEMIGPLNCASPHPVSNADFMRALREVSHRSIGLPATRWMLEIGAFFLRTETELLLKSRRVVPGRLLAAGYKFEFPGLRGALQDILDRGATATSYGSEK